MNKAPKLLLLTLGTLALLPLACAPASEPTAAPEGTAAPEATTPAPEATAAPEAQQLPTYLDPLTKGRYVERAGLRLFIPEGFEFGARIIPPDPRPPQYGGVAVWAHPGDPPSLDPYHTSSYLMNYAAAISYDALTRFYEKAGVDPLNNPMIGGLAESWDISDDFLTYTFHLRKGVKFHNLPPVNGRELDAEDVKATWELYRDPGSISKSVFASVDRVEVMDRYTVALHMKEVQPQQLTWLSESARGAIMPREVATPGTSQIRRLGGIGTGPFMATDPYEYKVGITFKRNPDYWVFDDGPGQGNRLPYLDGWRIVVIPDQNARTTAFRTGKIDSGTTIVVGGNLAAARALLRSNPTTIVTEGVGLASGGCYCFRLDKEPWSDVRVRRALSLALDYETIHKTLYGSYPWVMGLISGAWYGDNDSLYRSIELCACPWYSYDPQRAKALLAEAGYPEGLSTELVYFVYDQGQTERAELTAAYWQAIGVNLKIVSQDYTVYRRNVDLGGWDNIGLSFTCCGSLTIYTQMETLIPGSKENSQMGFINDPDLTAMAKEVVASYRDEARQLELIKQIRVRTLDQVFIIPSISGPTHGFFSPRLRNYQPTNTVPFVHFPRGWMYTWIDDSYSFAK